MSRWLDGCVENVCEKGQEVGESVLCHERKSCVSPHLAFVRVPARLSGTWRATRHRRPVASVRPNDAVDV